MPDLLQAARAVDHRRFIQFLIDSGQRRDIDDRVPAQILPYAGGHIDRPEPFALRHEVDGSPSQFLDDDIDNTSVRRQYHEQDTDDGNRRDEVRQIADRLHKLLIPEVAYFIQQNRENNRHRESKDQIVEVQEDRIDNDPTAVHVSEELQKVLESDPGTAQNPRADFIILEGDDHAVHGDIMEDNIVDQSRQQQKLQILGPVQTLQQVPPRTLFTPGRRYSYIGHRITFFLSETFLLTGAIAVISSSHDSPLILFMCNYAGMVTADIVKVK